MTGTYPVLLDGKHKGTLRVTQEGLNTLFEVRCEHPGRMVRLSVYGQGREGYLGVPAPEGGSLVLRRRLSRAAMAGFPETIEYAGEAGGNQAAGAAQPAAKPPERERAPAQPGPAPESQASAAQAGKKGAAGRDGGAARGKAPAAAQPEREAAEEKPDLLWRQMGDGSLFTTWQGRQFRAIPLAPHGVPLGRLVEKRVIEGVEYGVYELRDGRMV